MTAYTIALFVIFLLALILAAGLSVLMGNIPLAIAIGLVMLALCLVVGWNLWRENERQE